MPLPSLIVQNYEQRIGADVGGLPAEIPWGSMAWSPSLGRGVMFNSFEEEENPNLNVTLQYTMDGVNYNAVYLPIDAGGRRKWIDVIWDEAEEEFLAVGVYTTNAVDYYFISATSDDGIDWTIVITTIEVSFSVSLSSKPFLTKGNEVILIGSLNVSVIIDGDPEFIPGVIRTSNFGSSWVFSPFVESLEEAETRIASPVFSPADNVFITYSSKDIGEENNILAYWSSATGETWSYGNLGEFISDPVCIVIQGTTQDIYFITDLNIYRGTGGASIEIIGPQPDPDIHSIYGANWINNEIGFVLSAFGSGAESSVFQTLDFLEFTDPVDIDIYRLSKLIYAEELEILIGSSIATDNDGVGSIAVGLFPAGYTLTLSFRISGTILNGRLIAVLSWTPRLGARQYRVQRYYPTILEWITIYTTYETYFDYDENSNGLLPNTEYIFRVVAYESVDGSFEEEFIYDSASGTTGDINPVPDELPIPRRVRPIILSPGQVLNVRGGGPLEVRLIP